MHATATGWTHATDEELLRAFRGGDFDAFVALYARHRTAVFSYLRLHAIGARADALFHATWTGLIDRRDEAITDGEFPAKLFGIAHDLVRDALHGDELRWAEVERQEIASVADRLRDITHRSRSRALRLRRAIGQLPEHQRESFLLYEAGGLRLPSVAAVEDAEVGAAAHRMHQALRTLRAGIERVEALLK